MLSVIIIAHYLVLPEEVRMNYTKCQKLAQNCSSFFIFYENFGGWSWV